MTNYGLLHNHTMHSIKDSVVRVGELVKKATELGFKAVALTDHGSMTGCYEFYNECKKAEIKPILGSELYVKDYSFGHRLHLIVMAKDYQGYQALIKCVKLSNKHIQRVGTLIFPESNEEILRECFGEGTPGYGHVIATSACINGVIAGLASQNDDLTDKVEVIKEKLNKHERSKAQIKQFNLMIDEYLKVNTPEAKEKIKAIKKGITTLKASVLEDNVVNELSKNLKTLSNLYKASKSELRDFMESETKRYDNLFGHGNFYIELQYHGMAEEKEWMFYLDVIASKLDIPTCAANDAHMIDNSEESIYARQTITSLRWNDLKEVDDSEKECYVKSSDELFKCISAVVGPKRAEKAMKGIEDIVDACNAELPENPKHYPVFDKSKDSMKLLVEEVKKGIKNRFPNGDMPANYKDRLNYELKIMKQMKVADYILIVQDLLRFGRKLGKMPRKRYKYLSKHIWEMTYDEIVAYVDADQSYFGYVVGPGRGSSAGSLVCYMIGITDLDPIPYGLLFERFLNPERVSMPKQYWAFNVNLITQGCVA